MLTYNQRYKPRTEREYTKSDLTVYDSAGNTALNTLKVYGKSEIVDGAIKSAGDSGSIEVRSYTGTNQFGGLYFAQKLNIASNVSVINTTNKTVTFQRYSNITPVVYDNFKPNTQYTFIMRYSNTALNNSLRIKYNTGSDDIFEFTASNTKSTIVLTTDPTRNVAQLYLTYYSAGETTLYYDECGIFEGVKTASDFEPYNGTMATFSTGTPLYGVSDTVRDVMEWDGSAGTVTKKCAEVRLADLSWGRYATGGFAANLNGSPIGIIALICSKYPYDNSVTFNWDNFNNYDNKTLYRSTGIGVYIKDTDYNTVPDFVASLGDAELVYELATPTTEPLTQTENTSIASLRTFDGTTHFTNNASTDMTANYTIKVPTIS